jgi:hypothetical protein
VKGVVHSVVRDLQFLGNFCHGIVAIISQKKNRLTSFRRKFFVSGHFVIEPTNADAPDNSATVFSCANIIAKEISNDQLAFQNYKLGLANTTCHWNTGVMVADNGPQYAYGDNP